jgi:hypothetical protein
MTSNVVAHRLSGDRTTVDVRRLLSEGMALFEQRFSEEEVRAARTKIAAGASLRSVAAEIGCAPSTLSVRIKKAKAAEAGMRARAGFGIGGQPGAEGTRMERDSFGPAGQKGATSDNPGPVEVLRGALGAMKASGQPDWPTRVAAARALAALRPDEVKPTTEPALEASIVVYDLPPGTEPVLHCARIRGAEDPVSEAEGPSSAVVERSESHVFWWQHDGELELIGTWGYPELAGESGAVVKPLMHEAEDAETAERWRAELAAGKLPQTSN